MTLKKSIIVYYSFEGSTRLIAQTIAKEIGAELLELKPKNDIKSTGFMKYIWGGKQVVHKTKPELEKYEFDHSKYSLIILGTPVWAFTYTPAMRTFLAENKIQGKNVAFFCCHEGTMGKTLNHFEFELTNKPDQKNVVVSKMDFVNVKKNNDENLEKAKNWALELK